jgi:hypothetical protein
VALEALHRFFKKHDISAEDFALQPISSRFRIANPTLAPLSSSNHQSSDHRPERSATGRTHRASSQSNSASSISGTSSNSAKHLAAKDASAEVPDKITVKISTLPEVSAAFLEETLGTNEPSNLAPLIDDSVPEGSLIILGSHSEDKLAPLREISRIYYQNFLHSPAQHPGRSAIWPILTIQTTRPKAQQLVERLQAEGGVRAICFNPGNDPISGQVFRVGILQTEKGHLHLFNEYEIDDPADSLSLEKWVQTSASNFHCCGCIIATGATGLKRGRPTIKEVVAFFEMPEKRPEELDLAPLIMSYFPE